MADSLSAELDTIVSEYISAHDSNVKDDEYFMSLALKLSSAAARHGEVPVACVIAREGKIISYDINRRETEKDPTYHAETAAIRTASAVLGGWRLVGCTLYVTLEPCPMCAGAIVNARVPRVVFGAKDYKAGAFGSVINLSSYPLNFRPEIKSGVCENEAKAQLREFFTSRRGRTK